MSITGQKILGVLAVAIGVVGLVGMGIHEVANSCEKNTTTAVSADAGAKTTALNASGGSCPASKAARNASVHAMMTGSDAGSCCPAMKSAKTASYAAADVKAAGSSCCSKSASATVASHEAECAARIASGECTPAECEAGNTASAQFASAAGHADMHACGDENKASTAGAEKSSCGSKEASASLVSSEGSSSSCASKSASGASYASSGSCTSTMSADYAKAGDRCSAKSSACADFKACSVKAGDLVKADSDKLEYYEHEKAQDGVALTDVKLPRFTATDLAGNKVDSSELVGQPTVLVMLATHCGHSYESQPVLQQAAMDYQAKGLRVVGLVVGTSTEDAKKWVGPAGTGYDVWVTPDASVADALESHLVPTYVLIDANGYVKAKLIGFKDTKEVEKNIPVLLVQAGESEGSIGS